MTRDMHGTVFDCAAGRHGDRGGQWTEPCELPTQHRHVIVMAYGLADLCDTHIQQVIDEGLVNDPYVGVDTTESDRRGMPRMYLSV